MSQVADGIPWVTERRSRTLPAHCWRLPVLPGRDDPMIRKSRPIILLVESDPDTLHRARLALARCGGDLFVARTTAAALELGRAFEIDVLVVSAHIDSTATGAELACQIRSLPGRDQVAVVITCEQQRAGVILRVHPWGPSFQIRKSGTSELLVPLIERLAQPTGPAEETRWHTGSERRRGYPRMAPPPVDVSPLAIPPSPTGSSFF